MGMSASLVGKVMVGGTQDSIINAHLHLCAL